MGPGLDGRPPRFLDRFLVFDASNRRFSYLVAPVQVGGIPELCYSLVNKKDELFITGYVMPYDSERDSYGCVGDWVIWWSVAEDAEGRDEK